MLQHTSIEVQDPSTLFIRTRQQSNSAGIVSAFHRAGCHVTNQIGILLSYCVVVDQQAVGTVVVKLTSSQEPQQKRIVSPRLQTWYKLTIKISIK